MKNGFKALGCHIYAGGFTLGVMKAGFQVLGHLEEWPFGVDTVRANLPIEVRIGVDSWEPDEYRGDVDWLYGNPPCASWSQAGVKVKNKERNIDRYKHDGRTQCTELLFSLVPQIRPTVFTWECVAAAKSNGAEFVAKQTEFMNEEGYHVYHLLFDGIDTGLPQHRKRFFFVGSKVRIDFKPPDEKRVTVREAWAKLKDPGEVPRISDGLKAILKAMPRNKGGHLAKFFMNGRELADMPRNPRTGYVMGRPSFLAARVPLDGFSPTVTGGQHLYHPTQARSLTTLEQQVLCGYPVDYEFQGRPSYRFAQIAKAVLPPPAYWLARHVAVGLKARQRARPGLTEHNFIGWRGREEQHLKAVFG